MNWKYLPAEPGNETTIWESRPKRTFQIYGGFEENGAFYALSMRDKHGYYNLIKHCHTLTQAKSIAEGYETRRLVRS